MKLIATYFNKMRGGKKAPPRAPLHEIFWSSLGGFIGIYLIYEIAHYNTLNMEDSLFLVGSFGASAILIYGIPQSPYAQPRNLIGGHIISAIVGVSCALLFASQPEIAAALAVSIALAFMHISRTIHPPGGATALIAVIGSDKIHQMSYWYVFSPIFVGAMIMLLVAVLVNNLSTSRRYPDYWL